MMRILFPLGDVMHNNPLIDNQDESAALLYV